MHSIFYVTPRVLLSRSRTARRTSATPPTPYSNPQTPISSKTASESASQAHTRPAALSRPAATRARRAATGSNDPSNSQPAKKVKQKGPQGADEPKTGDQGGKSAKRPSDDTDSAKPPAKKGKKASDSAAPAKSPAKKGKNGSDKATSANPPAKKDKKVSDDAIATKPPAKAKKGSDSTAPVKPPAKIGKCCLLNSKGGEFAHRDNPVRPMRNQNSHSDADEDYDGPGYMGTDDEEVEETAAMSSPPKKSGRVTSDVRGLQSLLLYLIALSPDSRQDRGRGRTRAASCKGRLVHHYGLHLLHVC